MMVDHGNALDVATTIPELPPGFVARENINMTIDAMLQADVDAVLLQGHDGVGKTTILTSYTRSRAATTVSLFLKPVRVSYELSGVITELYDQFRVLADPRRSISTEGVPTRSDLAALFQRLASRLRASGRCLTVVIDGLADVSYRDRAGATDIIELLPFGRRSFRFLFSGDVEPLLRATGCVWRDYPVTLFSTDETKQLFAGLEVDDGAIVRAHNACNGVVGQLAAVRRLVCSGVQIDEVLQKQPGELSHTMVLEWERAAPLTQVHPQLLAILAFDARSHSVDTLAQISGLSAELTEELVRSATFLDRSASGRIDFVSETFRVFAQRRLASLKQSTLERLIHTMLDNRAAPDTVTALPVLMSEARQFQQLVTLLDPGHFDALVAVTESITAVRSQARLGARSAEINGDDVSFFRFRLLQALASDVLATSDKRNEVAALISVGLRDEALSIARAALFKEQRLRLFSAALATLSDREEDIDASLRDELRQLCASTPLDTLTDEIVDIAADVFMVEPEAAIQLVERFGAISKRANVFDWIMALMSVRHAVRGRKVNVESFDEAAVHDRMTDPHARRFFTGMRLASIGRDADWILDRCETMSEASDRLTALRMWLQANSRRSDAIRVAAVALDLSVQIREFSPSLSVLRQFASVLPYADNVTAASALIARIDALLTSLPHRSPSIEYTRVQLLLARSQKKFGFDGALLRISELSLFIQQLTDPAVKAECMSRLYAHLPDVAPQTDAKRAQIELALLIDEVLTHSATHDDVIAPILQPLVAHQPALSFTFVDRINTDFRRDEVRAALLDELAPDCRTSDAVHLLVHQLDRIGDPLLRARTIVAALAASYKDPDAGPILGRALWQHAVELPAAEYRARAFAYISQAIPTGSSHTAAVEILAGALESIRSPDRRADVTFQVVRVLSVTDADAARRFLDDARTVRMAQAIPFGSVSSFFAATRLACRALRGVFETDRGFQEEFEAVLDACGRIPDVYLRLIVLGDLCFAADAGGRNDVGDTVHREHLWPALQEARDEAAARHWTALEVVGWSVFKRHERAFVAMLNDLPDRERERVVGAVVRTILQKMPITEPSEDPAYSGRDLSHKDCTDLAALLELVCDDALMFRAIKTVSRSATQRDTRLTREQKIELQEIFGSLVERKLPCSRKIQHEGYKWACVAELMRLRDEAEIRWRELAGYAAAVSNVPDAAYTLALVASAIPSKYHALKKEVIERSLQKARAVKVVSERSECLLNVADEVWRIDSHLAKTLLRETARELSIEEGNPPAEDRIDRLLNVAYRISPEFALALGSELDTDPARSRARAEASSARKTVEVRKRMLDGQDLHSEDADELDEASSLAEAAWRNLAALNAGSAPALPAGSLRKSLTAAGEAPIALSYPVFAWVVQNWVDRPGAKAKKGSALRGLAQASLLNAEIAKTVASGMTKQARPTQVSHIVPASLVIIKPGERRKALEAIRDWCSRISIPYLKIADQYFGPEDLDFIKAVSEIHPDSQISILTSEKHLRQLKLGGDWSSAFREAWTHMTIAEPPQMDIVVAGVPPSQLSPIHDRWWITIDSALDFGTSANSIGIGQQSSIKECDPETARHLEVSLDKYLLRSRRYVDAGRISYVTLSF